MAWGGVPLNARTAAMMDEAQTLYGSTITATQGSPNVGVGASAGTHDGEGVIDVVGADLDSIVYAMRMVGFAAWHRTTAEGFTPHVHGVAVGEPDLSPAAADQVTDYLEGRNGLATNAPDNGPREFVGQTWEGYLAGDPPAGPTRSFRGVQLGINVVVVTAGTLDPYSDIKTGINHRADSITVTVTAGDEFYVYLRPGDFEGTDVISLINWRLNASGHGTLVLAESFDPSYSYTPPFTWTGLGSVAIDTDTLALTATPGLPHAPEDLNGDDGAILLRITCTTGTVTLDWLALQVEPPSGLQTIDVDAGHWSLWRTPDELEETPSYAATCTIANGEFDAWTDSTYGMPAGPPGSPTPLIGDHINAQVVSSTSGTHAETWTGPPDGDPPVLSNSIAQSRLRSDTQWSTPAFSTYNHQVSTNHANIITTAEWETWPDLREMPSFMSGLTPGIDYAVKPGASGSTADPEVVGEFAAGDTESTEWNSLIFDATIINYSRDLLEPSASVRLTTGASYPSAIALGGPVQYDFADADTYTVTDFNQETAVGGPFTVSPAAGDGWTIEVESTLDVAVGMVPPVTTGGWDPPDMGGGGGNASHGATVEVASTSLIGIKVQMPDYRYWIPAWVRSPDALDTTDPEGALRYLRNRQRNDGLGGWSTPRAKGTSSRQLSLHNRGYE